MRDIKVLDCTLRDGGYINNWHFGKKNIKEIISSLIESKVDVVEVGFVTEKKSCDMNQSLFSSIEQITEYLPEFRGESEIVCMINFGEVDIENIPYKRDTQIDGIRLAFHKKDLKNALFMAEGLIKKGYMVFIQAMVSMSYSDIEFINLIKQINEINPYAFYIVDSFGVMKKYDLLRYYYLVENNLKGDICVGFHSHNNLQLSYSNAQVFASINTSRSKIIDSSVYGMGRGAGNLNTELFLSYLNETYGDRFNVDPLLFIIDKVLSFEYSKNYWGYSLPHLISAVNNCHPNYATYLDGKNTLNISDIRAIVSSIENSKKNNFDKGYIQELYDDYLSVEIDDIQQRKLLNSIVLDKKVLLLAPGKSLIDEEEKVKNFIKTENPLIISVNFIPDSFSVDYIFVSNNRRYKQLNGSDKRNIIATSNIKCLTGNEMMVFDYTKLLNDIYSVKDNAGLMLIRLFSQIGQKDVFVAGYDGYKHDNYDNYVTIDLSFVRTNDVMDNINKGMIDTIINLSDRIKVNFVTNQRHVKV